MPEMTHFCVAGLAKELEVTTATTYQVRNNHIKGILRFLTFVQHNFSGKIVFVQPIARMVNILIERCLYIIIKVQVEKSGLDHFEIFRLIKFRPS